MTYNIVLSILFNGVGNGFFGPLCPSDNTIDTYMTCNCVSFLVAVTPLSDASYWRILKFPIFSKHFFLGMVYFSVKIY